MVFPVNLGSGHSRLDKETTLNASYIDNTSYEDYIEIKLKLWGRHNCVGVFLCLFFTTVWKITVTGDNMVMKEQSGSRCCFFVPNPFLKTHR